jgi:hypothetical protein
MSRFEQRHISRSDTVSDRCQWRSQRTWRPYSNNWTAAWKKRKPFASNSKRKLLSVATQIGRFMEWAVQIHRTRRKQHAHVRMPTDDQTATRTDRHSAHRTAGLTRMGSFNPLAFLRRLFFFASVSPSATRTARRRTASGPDYWYAEPKVSVLSYKQPAGMSA